MRTSLISRFFAEKKGSIDGARSDDLRRAEFMSSSVFTSVTGNERGENGG